MKPKQAAAEKPAPQSDPAQDRKGFGAYFARQIDKLRNSRPDHSLEGFLAAIKHAIDYCGKRDWNTAEDLEEELEAQLCAKLRCVPGSVTAEFVARNRESKYPRILFLTQWGFREAVEGQLAFNLHFKPDRTLRPVK